MASHMGRRKFLATLGGAAAWPLGARAQPAERVRRIGVLTPFAADDTESMARIAAFLQGLGDLGWAVGRNVRIDYRWSAGDPDRIRKDAMELVALAPDVILATGTPVTSALQQAGLSVPIVFAQVPDPVANGFVASLARPGGTATGINFYSGELTAKRLELLRELVPAATRVAVLVEPGNSESTASTLRDVEAAARGTRLRIQAFNTSSSSDIDAAFAGFVRERPDALLVASSPFFTDRRIQLALLAAVHAPWCRGRRWPARSRSHA